MTGRYQPAFRREAPRDKETESRRKSCLRDRVGQSSFVLRARVAAEAEVAEGGGGGGGDGGGSGVLLVVVAVSAAVVGARNKGSFQRWGRRFVSFRVVPE